MVVVRVGLETTEIYTCMRQVLNRAVGDRLGWRGVWGFTDGTHYGTSPPCHTQSNPFCCQHFSQKQCFRLPSIGTYACTANCLAQNAANSYGKTFELICATEKQVIWLMDLRERERREIQGSSSLLAPSLLCCSSNSSEGGLYRRLGP